MDVTEADTTRNAIQQDAPMPPTKAFTSHLARFAFTPSPTKLVPPQAAAAPSHLPPAPPQPTPTTPPAVLPTSITPRLSSARKVTRAVSRHFSSASAEAAAEAPSAAALVKAEAGEAYKSEAEEPARKKAKTGKSKKKPARAYADPSVYAHLGGVPDTLEGDLKLVLCGINPGIQSGQTGFHYANPTNLYWKLLFHSGLTERRLHPSEGPTLPQRGIGCTNLCPRTTAEQSELSKAEMTLGAPVLLKKMAKCRPRVLGFVGLGICGVVLRWLHALPRPPTVTPEGVKTEPGSTQLPSTPYWDSPAASPAKRPAKPAKPPKPPRKPAAPKAKPGLQPFFLSFPPTEMSADAERQKTYLWALPSTSARVTSYQFKDQEVLWKAMKAALDEMEAGEWDEPEGLVEYRWEEVEVHCAAPEPMVERVKTEENAIQ